MGEAKTASSIKCLCVKIDFFFFVLFLMQNVNRIHRTRIPII